MSIRNVSLILSLLAACCMTGLTARAQSATTTLAAGLKAPTKMTLTPRGNLIVAEAGNGPNTGRLSVVNTRTGERRTLLDGLPSALYQGASPNPEPSGPSGVVMQGRTLYLTIGQGNATIFQQGVERANPNPSSPILSSVLAVHLSANAEEATQGFVLTTADHQSLKDGARLRLDNGRGDRLTVELVADFENFRAEPRPGAEDNVRPSNPFGLAICEGILYVVDASWNQVRSVRLITGTVSTLTNFAPLPRSSTMPPGPPVMEAVPDSIRLHEGKLLVTLLTGFPFEPGKAEVRSVDPETGATESLIKGLSAAIDVLPVKRPGNSDHYLVLEFSANMLMGQPGRLSLYTSPDAAPVVIANPMVSPTSIARDTRTGNLFVTSIFTGQILKIDGARFFVRQHYLDFLNREPDAEGLNFWTGQITACGGDERCREQRQVDVSRAFFYSGEFISSHPELAEESRGTREYNRAFVRQSYLTYLRRTCEPEACDAAGFEFWLSKINARLPASDADYNEMIRAFILSGEYRNRLGLV